jgi:uncharacterized protein (UPF0147 family)
MVSKLENACTGLDMMIEDTSVPRNIRRNSEDARAILMDDSEAMDVRKAKAINLLDDMANDPNIPLHGRTLVWNILSQLETL